MLPTVLPTIVAVRGLDSADKFEAANGRSEWMVLIDGTEGDGGIMDDVSDCPVT